MQRFSEEFRGRFSRLDILDRIEANCGRLETLKRAGIDVQALVPECFEKGEMPRLPIKMMVLTQNAIRRGIELADSMIRDTNAFSYTPVFTSARSLFELASLIFDAHDKMQDIHYKWGMKAYLDLNEHLDNVNLGWKSEGLHPGRDKPEEFALRAKNVITIMERIEKKHIEGYFSLYELLSEVAHPNYLGMMEAYCKFGDGLLSAKFFDSPTRLDPDKILIALDNADGSLGMLADSIEKFERIFVDFSTLVAKMTDNQESRDVLRDWNKPIL